MYDSLSLEVHPDMVPSRTRRSWRARWLAASLALLLGATAAACGGDDDDEAATDDAGAEASGEPITLGYSAWPGWFPWKVTEEQGFFEEAGVEVELKWFDDYLASLTALSAGQLDANSQTLNDTLVGVSAGDDQVVVLVNDNSAGNDAIIVDESITSIEDLAGKSVAAEPGVVDHFLLLQGLDSVGLTEADIQFSGLPTADAAAAFSGGEFDAVGVFAPFTLQALERAGSKVLFDSADFPGTIPDFLVFNGDVVDERPEDIQKIIDAWYMTLEWIEANPDEANAIMAEQAGISAEEYASLAGGTRIFTRRGGPRQHQRRGRHRPAGHVPEGRGVPAGLGARRGGAVARRPLRRLVPPGPHRARRRMTAPSDASLVGEHRAATSTEVDSGETGRPSDGRPRPGRRGRPLGTLSRIRGTLPVRWRVGLGVLGLVGLVALWIVAAQSTAGAETGVRVPTPADTWSALADLWSTGTLQGDLGASAERIAYGYGISIVVGIVAGIAMGAFPGVEGGLEAPIGFLRYIPASALTPLMLLWLGVDEAPKITLIVVGTVFFNVLMVADVARAVPRELVSAAATLGASRRRIVMRVVLPHSWPGIVDVARINLAAAWLMLVVAELLAADEGLAVRIVRATRFQNFDVMFAVLIVFGVIGVLSDLALRGVRWAVAPWDR